MSARPDAGEPVGGAQSIRRALRVLRILAVGREHGVRLADVVAESGLSRPTVHRILRALIEEGAVEQNPRTRHYLIGHEVSLLGLARSAPLSVRTIAEPFLRQLAEQVGDTTFLTIRSRNDSICIDRKTGSYPVQVLALEVGGRRPLGIGVAGVVLLACLPEQEAEAIATFNAQRYAAQQVSLDALRAQVALARERGYAYAATGIVPGTRAVAVPLLDGMGEAIAAISIAAIADRLGEAQLAAHVALMRRHADAISRRLDEVTRARRFGAGVLRTAAGRGFGAG